MQILAGSRANTQIIAQAGYVIAKTYEIYIYIELYKLLISRSFGQYFAYFL